MPGLGDEVLFEKKEKIGYVTVNRPKALNALNATTIEALRLVFSQIKEDAEVEVVIVAGGGDRSFVAGADINELAVANPTEGKKLTAKGQRTFRSIELLGKPVIAAVSGFALGGGLELAMACHIRVASEKAKFGQPEINLGLIPGYGGTQRLPRMISKGLAIDMILTGEPIDAVEAYRLGLVNKVVPPAELIPAAEKIARVILSKGQVAVKFALDAIIGGLEMGLDEGMELESNLFGLICSTEDKKEGTKAFLEKRPAKFQGK